MCDKYLDECIVEVTKPITPAEREKLMLWKKELAKIEKDKALKDLEDIKSGKITDIRKLNLIKKKKMFSDEYNPLSNLDPWYT